MAIVIRTNLIGKQNILLAPTRDLAANCVSRTTHIHGMSIRLKEGGKTLKANIT